MKLGAILVKNKELEKCSKMRKIVLYIVDQIKNIDIGKMRLHPEFIKFICEIIENQVPKKSKVKNVDNMDKMQLFIEVYKEIHSNEEQINEAKFTVEFLLGNDMIKKTPYGAIVWYCIKKNFLRLVSLN